MIFSYGTKKYYEIELTKALFIETAVKKHVKECLAKGDNTDNAELLQCYSEIIEGATRCVERAQESYDEFISKGEENNG